MTEPNPALMEALGPTLAGLTDEAGVLEFAFVLENQAAYTYAFALTALLYAAVGFGGGSTYSALLALSGFDYRLLPVLALACNIVVVGGSTIRFARAGLTPWRRAATLTAIAAPAALASTVTRRSPERAGTKIGASFKIGARA